MQPAKSVGSYMRKRAISWVLIILTGMTASRVSAEEQQFFQVKVAEPYLELSAGPGRGYPVFHIVERGESVEVLKRRTDWFKVRTARGKEGWARREDMELTVTAGGEKTRFEEPGIGDFSSRRWEAGLLAGDSEGADVITAYAGYAMTQNFSAELALSKVIGDFSDAQVASINLLAQPFPDWRLSPYFSIGAGVIQTDPNVTLVAENDRTEQIGNAGLGARLYMTRRFIFRAEYRRYTVFQDKDDNLEIDEWKAGFAFFF
jgi:hypothetical protein